jgi:hypothetical protein
MAKLLTSLAVAHAKPYRRDGIAVLSEIRDGGCRGLRLLVHPTGHRTWIVRYRFHGRTRKLTLGAAVVARPGEPDPPNALTLANARKRAREALHKLAMGIDPAVEKLAERRPVAESAFATIATECFECSAKRGLRSAQRQLTDLQRRAFPMIGNIPIDAIRRSDIAKLLDQVEDTMGPAAADLTLEQISTVMNWWAARSDDYRPVLVRGMKRTNAKERARTRILSDPDLVEVWSAAKTAGVRCVLAIPAAGWMPPQRGAVHALVGIERGWRVGAGGGAQQVQTAGAASAQPGGTGVAQPATEVC